EVKGLGAFARIGLDLGFEIFNAGAQQPLWFEKSDLWLGKPLSFGFVIISIVPTVTLRIMIKVMLLSFYTWLVLLLQTCILRVTMMKIERTKLLLRTLKEKCFNFASQCTATDLSPQSGQRKDFLEILYARSVLFDEG
ncbi:hypothetical protein ACJX0J_007742, partial [Zea mays]